jgi:hypothetical protein
MFVVVQRTDTLPEMRALINSDHIVAVNPVGGGVKSRLTLSNGEVWEVSLPFTRAITLLHAELEIVEPVLPVDRRPGFTERRGTPAPPEPASGERPGERFVERRRTTDS